MMQDYQHELAIIKKLLKKNPNGMSVTDISRALKKNKNTIGRYLDILLISGQVDMRTYGMAKVFTLSQRVPLSAMLSYSKELIMVLDEEGRIVDVNDNFLKIMDLERGDAAGKNIEYLSPPNVDVHELLDTVAAGSKEGEDTVTFRIKDKGECIFKVKRVQTVFEDGGKGVTVILEDITEHILAEREIRGSEERFRMMADNIQDGLMIMENGKIIYANNRIAEITGYSNEELAVMKPLSIIAPESYENVVQQTRDIEAHRGEPGDLQMWIIRKDGERRFVYARISGVQHHDTYYNFIIFTDITELYTQGIKVRESEQRFRTMAENIRDGLLIIENNRIVFSNRRMTEISGFTKEEMAQLNFLDILSEDVSLAPELVKIVSTDGEHTLDEVIRDIKPGSDTPGEATFWINRKDGTQRCIHGNFSATEHDGILSVYITATDITSFAEKERALRDRIASLQELVS
ncbi:MAG: PAS domain-containing protein [Methanoregula sp.]|nr:MAG: PAS domain-containing protein [Methanoregula sp.]